MSRYSDDAYRDLVAFMHAIPKRTTIARIALNPADVAKYPSQKVTNPMEITSLLGTPLDHDASVPEGKARVTWSDDSTSIIPIE